MKSSVYNRMASPAWHLAVASAALLIMGCSKKEAAAPPPPPVAAAPAAEQPPAADGTARSVALSEVQSALDKKDYDTAVAGLIQGKYRPMSAAEKREYDRQFLEANQKLLDASASDPRAAAAYQEMGRAMMGR